ncbi:NAD-dependent epimerase/dehydratase family protein [Williamsia sp. CHRR-6]|uniref:NAD-dependent epimerase/dehydratase family protein n=1 Tax=Williamsia sp. CHRR-6 TaxID=2835871 RepID=UPI001BDA60D4|nr:NAD-dependent epimerase/dehydratase family protein [Williamsia sp. CHRR-6]MBT0568162.1 NAD-dependent epimerase/dehydratase family protein [Williamsia sp. CHRR-6]
MASTLILGGTAQLGGEIAAALLRRGDDVTCLARGQAGPMPPGVTAVHADRTMPNAYASVREHEWDSVIELSHELALVTGALAALASRARHWTLVSTISVYDDDTTIGADETASTVQPDDLSDYGQAKVAAERATADALGDRLLIARPGLIVGPGDRSDRFGYWVARCALAAQAGDAEHEEVLIPRVDDLWAQVIDVRDAAQWLVHAAATQTTGVVDVVGTPVPLGEVIDAAAEVAGHRRPRVVADDDWLVAHDVAYWGGPRSLPLWLPREMVGFARRANTAYRAAGGQERPLRETLRDTLADEQARGLDRDRVSGLTRSEELELIAAWARR